MRNWFQTSSCLCLLRRLFHPAIHLYLFTSAVLSFCHFYTKKNVGCHNQKVPTALLLHHYIEGGLLQSFRFALENIFLIILGVSHSILTENNKHPFEEKSISIKIHISRNSFNICEIQIYLESTVNDTSVLTIPEKEKPEHYSCEQRLSNSHASWLSRNYRTYIYPVGNPKLPCLIKRCYIGIN